MTFYNLYEFHDYIRTQMTTLNTNIALIDINEKNNDNTISEETYIVTTDKKSGDVNFFLTSGIQMTWLSLNGHLPRGVKSLEVKCIIVIKVVG